MPKKSCLECGAPFTAQRDTATFCAASCRKRWNNRRMQRGAELYDLFMACRFERDVAKDQGAWSLLCRMASNFRNEDEARRDGRRSWESLARIRQRNVRHAATVVGVNVAGNRRR